MAETVTFWERILRLFRSRYVLWLEGEVERLRQENRSMMNSLLTRAGVQPIDTPPPVARPGRRLSRHQFQVQIEREAARHASSVESKDN